MMPVLRFSLFVVLLLAILGSSGCRSMRGRDFPHHVARFFIETSERFPESHRNEITLPYSEANIIIDPRVQIGEWDIHHVDVFEAELGKAIAVHLMPDAARDVRMLSYNNQGRRLVLMVNGYPVGAKQINRGIENGVIFMYLEQPDEDLEELADYITRTSELARRRL